MKNLLRFISKVTLATACLSIFTVSAMAGNTNQPMTLDSVVAIVNTDVITQSELNQAVQMAQNELQQTNTPQPSPQQLQMQVLNQLIDHKVELQTATRMGITVSEDQLNQAIQGIAAKNKLTVSQMRDALAQQGINFAQYRKQIKEQMIIQQLLQRAVGSNINITPQDVKNAENSPYVLAQKHDEYHVDDILIALPDEPSSAQVQDAYAKAQSIITQLQKGANFKTLAAANSDGEEAMKGGDLGWRSLEELPTVFAAKVVNMKPGDVAGPIRTGNGIHVIKLEGFKDNATNHFVTETDVRHILIKTNLPSDDGPAKQQLEIIRNQIIHGANFADMAKKYSQDPGSAVKGGDLGWVMPGMLVPPFEQAMNQLAINQISQPVKTQFGWHLIQVLGRKQVNDSQQFQQNQIKQMIYMRQFNENAAIWVQQLRDDSYIKILI